MSDDHDAFIRQSAGSGKGGGASRSSQKRNAVLIGIGIAFAGFLGSGAEMQHNYTDPTVAAIGGVALLVALFAGK